MNPTPPKKLNELSKSINLIEVARLVDGELVGDASVAITGVAGIKEAKAGDITFLSNEKYLPFLDTTHASAVITSKEVISHAKPIVRTANPSQAFSKITSFFTNASSVRKAGVHASAILGEGVTLGKDVWIGPHVVVGDHSFIGDASVIEANVFIGANCVIGANTLIYPNVTLREKTEIGSNVIIHSGTVIGSDGFGYETIEGQHIKIPQIGSVLIEDDVEIGANVCIDRGRFQKTWIKKGSKIDNLVQIAHNVVIGENCLVVSQAGISGSTTLGKNVVIAGQAGLVGHIELGDRVIVGAGAGVTKSVPAETIVLGSPAKPIAEQKKLFALISRLPDLFKEFAEYKRSLKK